MAFPRQDCSYFTCQMNTMSKIFVAMLWFTQTLYKRFEKGFFFKQHVFIYQSQKLWDLFIKCLPRYPVDITHGINFSYTTVMLSQWIITQYCWNDVKNFWSKRLYKSYVKQHNVFHKHSLPPKQNFTMFCIPD